MYSSRYQTNHIGKIRNYHKGLHLQVSLRLWRQDLFALPLGNSAMSLCNLVFSQQQFSQDKNYL
jgi:hypothetical protein